MKVSLTLLRFLLVFGILAALPACETYKSQFLLGWTQMEAQGLHPVRANPPSMAYRRLQAHAKVNVAVKLFLQAKGYPDFLIEIPGFMNMRLICYYMKSNQAYLLESFGNQPGSTKILGPEPIGEKDKKLLRALDELEEAASAYSDTSSS